MQMPELNSSREKSESTTNVTHAHTHTHATQWTNTYVSMALCLPKAVPISYWTWKGLHTSMNHAHAVGLWPFAILFYSNGFKLVSRINVNMTSMHISTSIFLRVQRQFEWISLVFNVICDEYIIIIVLKNEAMIWSLLCAPHRPLHFCCTDLSDWPPNFISLTWISTIYSTLKLICSFFHTINLRW